MFWESVLGGLAVLVHWQVWVALAIYVALQLAWLVAIGMLMGNSDSVGRMAAGCLTHMIGGTALQPVLLGGLVFFLTPLMLGGDHAMPLAFFATFVWPIVTACFLALVISFIIMLLPIVGRLVGDTLGLNEFIQGIIIFRVFSVAFIERRLKGADLEVSNLYPGFWSSVGYFVLATVLVHVCLLTFAALRTAISRNRFGGDEGPSFFVGMALMNILGLLPLFMYANHVTLAIQNATR